MNTNSLFLITISTILLNILPSSNGAALDSFTDMPELNNSNETSTETTNISAISTTQSSASTQDSKNNSKKSESGSTDLPEFTSFRNTSTFTCYGRITGYYADVKLGCRVYHFCTQVDSIEGGPSFQRMSYICLEGSIFDQKDLNCVGEASIKVPCDKAESEYESSNKQFDARQESSPSMSDSLAANIMMNPITRFLAGR